MPGGASRIASRGRGGVRRGVRPGDTDLTFMQDDYDAAFRGLLQGTPFANGRLVELKFTASTLDQTFAHKLGGKVQGFIPVDLQTAITYYRTAPANTQLAATHVRFIGSAAGTVKVWVWR